MAYRHDEDLGFLSRCSDKDLDGLVNCLIYDNHGNPRWTEELSHNDNYKKYAPQHSKYWRDIAAEIQCFGGHTLATMFRGGKGVKYREVLTNVCDKLKVSYNKKDAVENIEQCLMLKILNNAFKKMDEDELRVFAHEPGLRNISNMTPQGVTAAFQLVFRLGGSTSYILTLKIANIILTALTGAGLTFGGSIILIRAMSILTGPIGWAVSTVWTLFEVGGTAYRVTIPAVIQITALRSRIKNEEAKKSV